MIWVRPLRCVFQPSTTTGPHVQCGWPTCTHTHPVRDYVVISLMGLFFQGMYYTAVRKYRKHKPQMARAVTRTPCLYRKAASSDRWSCTTSRGGPGFNFCQKSGKRCYLSKAKRFSGNALRKAVLMALKNTKYCTQAGAQVMIDVIDKTLKANRQHFWQESTIGFDEIVAEVREASPELLGD